MFFLLFSKLVLTLKWLHTECRLVHCDIRPHNIMCFNGSPVLIDFAFSESIYYPSIRELLEVTGKSLYPVFLELYSTLVKTDIDHTDFFEQVSSEISKAIGLFDLELASSVKKRVIPLFEDFRRQVDFEGASCQGSDSLLKSEVRTNKNSSEHSKRFNYNSSHNWFLT